MRAPSFMRSSWSWAVVAACLLPAVPAAGQATRTWVSGVGDDANPCSRTAPCKTFAGAISKTATGGEINVLDPGGFGAVTITKSITISSESFEAGVLVSGTNAIVVNAPATAVVVLRGLDFEGLGSGLNAIRFLAGGALHVESCTINNFAQKAISFEPSGASQLFVVDTIVRNNLVNAVQAGGILIKPTGAGSAVATIENVQMVNNRFGLRIEGDVRATVSGSAADGNLTNGFTVIANGFGPELNLKSCTASHNGTNGVRSAQAGAVIRMSGTQVIGNAANGLAANSGGAIVSFGDNHVDGNGVNGSPTSTLPPL